MILMKSKKDIVINLSIIAAIIVGYVIVTLLTTQPPVENFSFESSGSQVPLQPLGEDKAEPIVLKDLRGQALLLNFWASWCEACDTEHAYLEKLTEAVKGTPVKMIGIASSDTREAVEKSGKLKSKTFPQYLDASGDLARAVGVKTLPQTFLIDRQGRIVSHIKTAMDGAQAALLEKQIASLDGGLGVFGEVPDFSLRDSSDAPMSLSHLHGKVWVADFIFTNCQDMCPMMTAKLRELDREFKKDDRFNLVSISIDPTRDTPEVLRNYRKKLGVEDSNWHFLTGKFGSIKHLIGGGFKLGTPENPELHTSKFVLVDGAARIRGYYDSNSAESLEKLKADIGRALSEKL